MKISNAHKNLGVLSIHFQYTYVCNVNSLPTIFLQWVSYIHARSPYVLNSHTDGHLVPHECPCFVRVDNIGTSQCLHYLQ